jgi:hypothetical protein
VTSSIRKRGHSKKINRIGQGKQHIPDCCTFTPDSGPYSDKQCESAARNDQPALHSTIQGRQEHYWTIATFLDEFSMHDHPVIGSSAASKQSQRLESMINH